MTNHSRPDSWLQPRPYTDPSLRRMKYGRLLPMEEASSPQRRLAWAFAQGLIMMLGFFALFFLFAVMTP